MEQKHKKLNVIIPVIIAVLWLVGVPIIAIINDKFYYQPTTYFGVSAALAALLIYYVTSVPALSIVSLTAYFLNRKKKSACLAANALIGVVCALLYVILAFFDLKYYRISWFCVPATMTVWIIMLFSRFVKGKTKRGA